jgi:flavin reductase (DIM6/NTAB) family NADH-FMN oxidoreductase RutF
VGDHEVVVGEVKRGRGPAQADGKPWVHTRKNGFQY